MRIETPFYVRGGFTFNSLFEMHLYKYEGDPDLSAIQLSILYLRCPKRQYIVSSVAVETLSILYLRCTNLVTEDHVREILKPFNSLFEMQRR